jgi:hypothetical protein
MKQLIESLIKDLYENKSLSEIFLKLQTVVFILKNEQLTEWFIKENSGYNSDISCPIIAFCLSHFSLKLNKIEVLEVVL